MVINNTNNNINTNNNKREVVNRIGSANGNGVGMAAATAVTEPKKSMLTYIAERNIEMNFQHDDSRCTN